MNFSWAVHIDPKGSANQHKEFMEPNQTSTNELVVHPSQTDGSDFSSTPGTTPFTQRSSFMNHGTMDSSGSFSNHIRNTSNIRTRKYKRVIFFQIQDLIFEFFFPF